MLIEKRLKTPYGDVHYWISEKLTADRITLFFLHGLTASHDLFNGQIEFFADKYNIISLPGMHLRMVLHGLMKISRMRKRLWMRKRSWTITVSVKRCLSASQWADSSRNPLSKDFLMS